MPGNNSWIILVAIIGVAGLIALIAFLIYRYTHLKMKDDKPSEKEILNEEMDRLLQPIEDDKVAKEVEQYQEDDDK